ncbi:HTTM domain-containing protein [Hymenobacter lapidiphilus]|uniref:HTTM domain-containing protein n=1 Tax=Hymenobacter lapidiphilus TaxID=2608003 RepID=A0A7Y7PQ19_9BACT|nr:HTTM domain-containing protein [Hymenobacter lapidiphilus]NVO31945.1 HTTM domain-containing protein [Hymenobacter lapidiphilus]
MPTLTSPTSWLMRPVSAAPLVVFRVLFGGMMLASIVRFAAKGWITDLYVAPKVFFPYYGFEWVQPAGALGMHVVFGLMALAALGIMLGAWYRWSAVVFFLAFTYVELLDKSNYLNHYYFVSVVAFLLIWVPANAQFSLDTRWQPERWRATVPQWAGLLLRTQMGMVYFFAGVAKLNPDWLFEAMPLRLWLPAHTDLPLIGGLFDQLWVAYAFSWFGAFYDLTIPFFLSARLTRYWAYVTVVVFHVLTAVLFQIGMFPYIMMVSTLLFFPASFHEKLLGWGRRLLGRDAALSISAPAATFATPAAPRGLVVALGLWLLVHVLLPWRFVLYPGDLFWSEQGYRFSWRVMLMEKSGTAFFYVRDPRTGHETEIRNRDYLTVTQEKQVATQPDMLLQFAHILRDDYRRRGVPNPQVRAEAYVTLNGRSSRLLINPKLDLAQQQEGFGAKAWILPLEQVEPAGK